MRPIQVEPSAAARSMRSGMITPLAAPVVPDVYRICRNVVVGLRHRRRRHRRRPGVEHRLRERCARRGLAPQHLHRRAALRDHFRQRRRVLGVGDQPRRIGVGEDVRQAHALQRGVDRDLHRAELHQREEGDDVVEVVREHDRDVHAGAHALPVQDGGGVSHALREPRVRHVDAVGPAVDVPRLARRARGEQLRHVVFGREEGGRAQHHGLRPSSAGGPGRPRSRRSSRGRASGGR